MKTCRVMQFVEQVIKESQFERCNGEVWAYGSRVNGKAHQGSDLDLVIRTPNLQTLPIEIFLDLIKYGKDHKHLADSEIPLYGSGGIMRYLIRLCMSKRVF